MECWSTLGPMVVDCWRLVRDRGVGARTGGELDSMEVLVRWTLVTLIKHWQAVVCSVQAGRSTEQQAAAALSRYT